jgi:hypothetical protein
MGRARGKPFSTRAKTRTTLSLSEREGVQGFVEKGRLRSRVTLGEVQLMLDA